MKLLVTSLVALAAGCVSVADRGVAGTDRIVRSVEIAGNEAIGDQPIVEGLATRPPRGILFRTYQPFDPLALQVDVDRIVHYYKTQGYFSARVTDTEVREVGDRFVAVRFRVDEGEPARITAVQLAGVPPDLRQRMDLQRLAGAVRAGRSFDQEAYEEALQRLRRWFLERGYAHVEVDGTVAVDREASTAAVTFAVRPGPRARFGTTTVLGLEDVPESAVYNRVAWEPGDVFDPDRLELTRARLHELGLLGFVRIDYERADEPAVVDMTIRVTEIEARDVRLGVGVGMDPASWSIHARASYTHRSFLDPLLILRVDARPGYAFRRSEGGRQGLGGEARLTLERADFLLPRLYGRAMVSYDQSEIDLYRASGPSARVDLYRAFLDNRLLASAGWEIDYLFLDAVPPSVWAHAGALGIADPYRNAYFEQTVVYDRRDSLIDPTQGIYSELRIEEGGAFAGGAFSYVRATGEVRGYAPITTPRLVLASRVRYGRTVHGTLPTTRRYFSGGANGHRGFAQRHLSPNTWSVAGPGDGEGRGDGTDGAPQDQVGGAGPYLVGGAELFETSLELRWDFVEVWDEWLGAVAFIDGGDVPLEAGGLDLADLHWAVGAGLRYDTPIGPVRFDVGYRITALEPPLSVLVPDRWAFHLTLGEAF